MSKSQDPFALRKAPVQERSRQMFQWILDAAIHLFEEKDFESATTNEIAERAGVSIGSLYQYFPNKEAILLQLLKQHSERVFGALEKVLGASSVRAQPPEYLVRAVLALMDEHHQDTPTLHRMFWSKAPFSDELAQFKQACRERLRASLANLIQLHPALYVEDPDISAWILIQIVSNVVHEHHYQEDSPSKERIFQELEHIILGYLLVKEHPLAKTGSMS
ncbi:MAG: TetR/AcrR family transcriptional regulator [Myxococcales bacterium]|nr:TetR/AcrR family transcriptional regulator [Myxococcales bacterium]